MRVPFKHKVSDQLEELHHVDIDDAYVEDLRKQGLGDFLDLILEKYTTGNYTDWLFDIQNSMIGEDLKKPLKYLPAWQRVPEAHAHKASKLNDSKAWYDKHLADDTLPEDKKTTYLRELADIENEIATHNAISPDDYMPDRINMKPYLYAPFDKKGKPKKGLMSFYKDLRGTVGVRIDKAGNLVAPYANISIDAPNQTLIRNLIKERTVLYDPDSGTAIIPAPIVKKIDPYYKDYNKTLNAIRQELGIFTDPDKRINGSLQTQASDFGRHISLRALKNLQKSTSMRSAYDEIKHFINDHAYHIRYDQNPDVPYTKDSEFDSLNQVRAAGENLTAIARATAQRREREKIAKVATPEQIAEQLQKDGWTNNEGAWTDPEGETYTEEEAAKIARDRIVEWRLNAPYEYSKDVTGVIGEGAWHLPTSPQDLRDRSELHNICVGSSKMPYINAIRNHDTVILLKDDATAEIQLTTDTEGYITKTYINQVKGNKNTPLRVDPELKAISENLVGKNVQDISESVDNPAIEDKISDIIMKHNLRPITTAIHRRF